MADITITCGNCGNRITVSEYVEADTLTCMKCRQAVPIPKRTPEPTSSPQLKLAQPTPAPHDTPSTAAPGKAGLSLAEEVRQNTPAMKRLRRTRRRAGFGPAVAAYVVFVVLAAAFLYLRFSPGAVTPAQRELLITGAIAALGFLHVSVIAYAFADEAFHGVMCAIIPGYSLYYLFTNADQFLIRAVVAALLVAFGLDTAQAIRRFSMDVYVDISSWIQDTDSLKKNRVPDIK